MAAETDIAEPSSCAHGGQLVEVPELRMVRCNACSEMWETAERHFAPRRGPR